MKFEDLSPELQEKVRACKSTEKLLALAKVEGQELSEDQLAAISGGSWCWDVCEEQEYASADPCPEKHPFY